MTPFEIAVLVWLGILTIALVVTCGNKPDLGLLKEQSRNIGWQAATMAMQDHERKWHPETRSKPAFQVPEDVNVKSKDDLIKAMVDIHFAGKDFKSRSKKT